MEGEFLGKVAVLPSPELRRVGQEAHSAWQESLRRIARAQALLWHRTPIQVRQGLLAEVDAESEAGK